MNSSENDPWIPVNLDDGHLNYYFFLLASLMGLNLVYFVYIAKDYEYKTEDDLTIMEEDSDGRLDRPVEGSSDFDRLIPSTNHSSTDNTTSTASTTLR